MSDPTTTSHKWVVIVTERNVWPAKHGCDARIVQLIRGYKKNGFKVALVGTRHSENQKAKHLVDFYFMTPGPSWDWEQDINTFDAGWFFGGIMECMRRFNVVAVQVEYIWMTHALKVVPEGILKIVDTHDLMYRRAGIYDPHGILPYCRITKEHEAELLNRADVILAIQENEAKEFREMCPDRQVITVGHWIDNIRKMSCDENSNIVMLVGSDNPSNVMGGKMIAYQWAEVRGELPDAELRVYGSLGGKLPKVEGVYTYGFVQKLERAYATAKLVINPTTLGTGLKIKTVEAMAYGKAVVTTSCGADGIFNGVCVSNELPKDIVRILKDGNERRRLEQAAHRYATENFSAEAVMREVVGRIGNSVP
jgi:glycosyltransferase involved in cell wall biosynthesis